MQKCMSFTDNSAKTVNILSSVLWQDEVCAITWGQAVMVATAQVRKFITYPISPSLTFLAIIRQLTIDLSL